MAKFKRALAPDSAAPSEQQTLAEQDSSAGPEPAAPKSTRAKARVNKKPVLGYFSPELSRELRKMAVEKDTTMQALLGEAIDMLMTANGRNRFDER